MFLSIIKSQFEDNSFLTELPVYRSSVNTEIPPPVTLIYV